MQDVQSLANQLAWCITTKDYLTDLVKNLLYVKMKYGNTVELLEESGYLKEPLEQVKGMYKEFSDTIDDLVKHIVKDHLDYIEEQCRNIRETLQQYV